MKPITFSNSFYVNTSFVKYNVYAANLQISVNCKINVSYIPSRSSSLFACILGTKIQVNDKTPIAKQIVMPKIANSAYKNHVVFVRKVCLCNVKSCLAKNCDSTDCSTCTLNASTPVGLEILGNGSTNPPFGKTIMKLSKTYSAENKDLYIVIKLQGIPMDSNVYFKIDREADICIKNIIVSDILRENVDSYYDTKNTSVAADYDPNSPKIYISGNEEK